MADEVTKLSPKDEQLFQLWAALNNVTDIDNGKYDYRGWFKDQRNPSIRPKGQHYPDTYKQHGHPTFSNESQYAAGGPMSGRWEGETFILPNGLRFDMNDPEARDLFQSISEDPALTVWPMKSHGR